MFVKRSFYLASALVLAFTLPACSDDDNGPTLPCPEGGLKTKEQIENASDYKCNKPQICPDISFLTFPSGGYIISNTAPPYPLGVGITNCSTGNEKLKILGLKVFGDKNCHFSKPEMEADGYEIDPGFNNTKQMQMTWQPKKTGEDHIEVAILTNAENYPEFIIPGCAIACEPKLDQGVVPEAGWGDAGAPPQGCGQAPTQCDDVPNTENPACK